MRRNVATALVLLAALLCYALGFGTGAMILVASGAALELWFWVRLFSRRGTSETSATL